METAAVKLKTLSIPKFLQSLPLTGMETLWLLQFAQSLLAVSLITSPHGDGNP
ncbi:hypothetical protein [Nostoc sp.]